MSQNKYARTVRGVGGEVAIDVYDVLVAFGVTCPARAHAVKKILAAGQRGSKSELQDLQEAKQSLDRACDLLPLSEEDRALLEVERVLDAPGVVGRPEDGTAKKRPSWTEPSGPEARGGW